MNDISFIQRCKRTDMFFVWSLYLIDCVFCVLMYYQKDANIFFFLLLLSASFLTAIIVHMKFGVAVKYG